MNIQTISIVVPTKGCVNKCPFCVSRMHDSPYENKWDEVQIKKRIQYAVMNGVNTCIITGTGEALQNYNFLLNLENLFDDMYNPFPNIELQTTGVFLSEKIDISQTHTYKSHLHIKDNKSSIIYPNIKVLKDLKVNTVSLSVCDIFDNDNNLKIIGVSERLKFHLGNLIDLLKEQGFNVRLSINMLNIYDKYMPEDIISKCKGLQANQITFRKMYSSGETEESKWVKNNRCSDKTLENIKKYVEGEHYINVAGNQIDYYGHGKLLYKLPFGGKVYSINGMSVVIDDDCMSKENNESLKYIILRENGKLYCRWDDEGSLIF